MAKKPSTREMSDQHEQFLAELLDGRIAKGSGNQFNNPMDGRNGRDMPHALAWDGKSTFAGSLSISREMWAKAVVQSKDQMPMLALRFYNDYTLQPVRDLVVLDAHDFAEILADARAFKERTNGAR